MLVTVIAFVKLSEFAAAFVAFWQRRVDLKVENYWSAIKLAPQRPAGHVLFGGGYRRGPGIDSYAIETKVGTPES